VQAERRDEGHRTMTRKQNRPENDRRKKKRRERSRRGKGGQAS